MNSSPNTSFPTTAPARGRGGFTAVELLVVLAIITVLIALLLPSVQAAREAARLMQCRNQMMQLGLALHSYHHTHGTLPPGSINGTAPLPSDETGYAMGWIPQILPDLDQSLLFQMVDFQSSVYAEENDDAVMSAPTSLLFCPSIRNVGVSYAACYHDVEAPIDVDQNGVMFLNSRIRFRDVSDGTHATLMLGEAFGGQNWLAGDRSTLRNGSGLGSMEPFVDYTSGAPFAFTPEDREEADTQAVIGGFGSSHSLGINACFVDGHVQHLARNMDQKVFQNLSNRRDGNLVESFE